MAPNLSYHRIASECLQRARREMESGDDSRLTYAALELRQAIEALAYALAVEYENSLSAKALDIWEPPAVMRAILSIDPDADRPGHYRVEIGHAEDPNRLVIEGEKFIFGMRAIRDTYQSLSNRLHVPTVGMMRKGKAHNPERLRSKCEEVAALIDRALSATFQAMRFPPAVDFPCGRCGKRIVRHFRSKPETTDLACIHCAATYRVIAGDKLSIHPLGMDIKCPNVACGELVFLWLDEFRLHEAKPRPTFHCRQCRQRFTFGVAALRIPPDAKRL